MFARELKQLIVFVAAALLALMIWTMLGPGFAAGWREYQEDQEVMRKHAELQRGR